MARASGWAGTPAWPAAKCIFPAAPMTQGGLGPCLAGRSSQGPQLGVSTQQPGCVASSPAASLELGPPLPCSQQLLPTLAWGAQPPVMPLLGSLWLGRGSVATHQYCPLPSEHPCALGIVVVVVVVGSTSPALAGLPRGSLKQKGRECLASWGRNM